MPSSPNMSDDGSNGTAVRDAAAGHLTTGQLAARLRVHPATVRRLARRGRLIAPVRVGGVLRFPLAAVEAYESAGGTRRSTGETVPGTTEQ